MYALEFYSPIENNWTGQIGEYNTFETLEEAKQAIPELQKADIGVECAWRILDENECVVFIQKGK